MKPIRLLVAVLVVALAWSGWWGWSAWKAKADLRGWLEARRADGWQAEWSAIRVTGFPNRVDITVEEPALADPAGGWAWNAPFVQILRLSYDKDRAIFVWPDRMSLQTPYERITIAGEEMRASVSFLPGRAREVLDSALVFRGMEISSDAGWTTSVREARLAVRPNAQNAALRDIGLEVTGLKPRSDVIATLADAGVVPATVERLRADLTVEFDTPWDRQALEERRPQPTSMDIHEIAASWGQLDLRIAGKLAADDAGRADGEVLVKATNWEEILDVARQSGAVPAGIADTVESALRLLSRVAGSPKTLDIPLSFEDGRMRAGPVPLGSAPELRLP
ncbi:DUF2125 domain-containing protein [Tropicimonas marinistellae]|uniref:DUF2125 domain-containing protein n=1 Tax=Tropicimonas marinistellae TaxID=1739787 RepID=UPI00082FBF7A|nr:DUF2125 domain-containing protein [Tropicimonas marinistellae]